MLVHSSVTAARPGFCAAGQESGTRSRRDVHMPIALSVRIQLQKRACACGSRHVVAGELLAEQVLGESGRVAVLKRDSLGGRNHLPTSKLGVRGMHSSSGCARRPQLEQLEIALAVGTRSLRLWGESTSPSAPDASHCLNTARDTHSKQCWRRSGQMPPKQCQPSSKRTL
jgi:hypothetical protein